MASFWFDKARKEIHSQSKHLQAGELETPRGSGLLWRKALEDGKNQRCRWEFWKRRLKVIKEFKRSGEDIKGLVRKMQERMGEIERGSEG